MASPAKGFGITSPGQRTSPAPIFTAEQSREIRQAFNGVSRVQGATQPIFKMPPTSPSRLALASLPPTSPGRASSRSAGGKENSPKRRLRVSPIGKSPRRQRVTSPRAPASPSARSVTLSLPSPADSVASRGVTLSLPSPADSAVPRVLPEAPAQIARAVLFPPRLPCPPSPAGGFIDPDTAASWDWEKEAHAEQKALEAQAAHEQSLVQDYLHSMSSAEAIFEHHIGQELRESVSVDEAIAIQAGLEQERLQVNHKALIRAQTAYEVLQALDPQEVFALTGVIFGGAAQDVDECKQMLCDLAAFDAAGAPNFEEQPLNLTAIVDLIPGDRSNEEKASRILWYFYHMFPEVKEINASRLGLVEMPETIGTFPFLRKVDLSHNRLTSVPEFLQHDYSPKVLDLSHNQIADSEKRLNLPATEILDMSSNALTHIPHFAVGGGNRALRELNLQDCHITTSEGIGSLHNVERLNLSGNLMKEFVLPEGLIFAKMRFLDLLNNPLAHRFAQTLRGQMPALQELRFFAGAQEDFDEQIDVLSPVGHTSIISQVLLDRRAFVTFVSLDRYRQEPVEQAPMQLDLSLPKGSCQEVTLADGSRLIRYNPA